jgi:hypothetical protein
MALVASFPLPVRYAGRTTSPLKINVTADGQRISLAMTAKPEP